VASYKLRTPYATGVADSNAGCVTRQASPANPTHMKGDILMYVSGASHSVLSSDCTGK